MPRFSLGINYWPRRSAMWMWDRFDRGEIDDDFAHIAALGLTDVRFFLLWEAFAPQPDRLDANAVRNFATVLDLLAAHGLRGMATLFTGHMSGVNFIPPWALDASEPHGRFRTISGGAESPYGIGDFYGGMLLEAQLFAADGLARAVRGHDALFAWDLGNEFSNMREPASPQDAARWSARLTDALQRVDPSVAVTGGLHGEDLTRDRNIRPSTIAAPWSFATMHGYPVYSAFARDRFDAEVCPFLAALAGDFTGKPVLFSELGNPTCPPGKQSPYDREPLPDEPPPPRVPDTTRYATYACLSEDEMATYARRVIARLHEIGTLGAYWWCWADYVPELAARPPFDRAPHELSFGIVRTTGEEKAVCDTLAAIAREGLTVAPRSVHIAREVPFYENAASNVAPLYAEFVSARSMPEVTT